MIPAVGAEERGSGPAVAYLHGFTQTGRSWRRFDDLVSTQHRSLFVDLPGHGRSAAVRANLPDGARMIAERCGDAVYVGYSLGGRFALHLALDAAVGPSVRALVLVGATAGLDSDSERAERRAGDERLAVELERDGVRTFVGRWLENSLFATLSPADAMVDDRCRNDAAGLASSLRLAGTGTQEPLWSDLHRIEVPVLVLAGEHDEKFGVLGRRLAAAIGTNAEFGSIPGAGHSAHLEQPVAVAARLDRFLERAGLDTAR